MTRFNARIVKKLVSDVGKSMPTTTSNSKVTLSEKQLELLLVLRRAEAEYERALLLDRCRMQDRRLSSIARDCRQISSLLKRAETRWGSLSPIAKEEIVRFAPDVHSRDDSNSFVERFEEVITLMVNTAERCASEPRRSWRGRPSTGRSGVSIFALTEFTKIVRQFWIINISLGFSFGYSEVFGKGTHPQKGRKQLNQASLFLLGAAQKMDARCDEANIRQAMERAARDPTLDGTYDETAGLLERLRALPGGPLSIAPR